MSSQKNGSMLALETQEEQDEERTDERSVYLEHGRTLTVASEGMDELIEIRASSGQMELRIRMTEDGPVLQLEGVKLAVKAAETLDLECKSFKVEAESVEIASKGEMKVSSEGEMNIESSKDVRVRGDKIWLN
jgi:hypothetical protein